MKRYLVCSVILSITLFSIASAIADIPKGMIDGDANWFFHFKPYQFWHTDLGEVVEKAMPQEARQRIEEIADFLKADPMQDFHSITVYGQNTETDEGILVVKGRFDQPHLMSLLKSDSHFREYSHRHHSVYRWQAAEDKMSYGAFATVNTILISNSIEALKKGLDIGDGKAPSIVHNQRFTQLDEVPAGAFMVAFIDNLGELVAEHGQTTILRKANSLLLYTVEQAGNLYLATVIDIGDIESAKLMAQVGTGMISLAKLRNEADKPNLADILQAIDIEVEKSKLRVTFNYPSINLAGVIHELSRHAKQAKILLNP